MAPPYGPLQPPRVDPAVAAKVGLRGELALGCAIVGVLVAGGTMVATRSGFVVGGPIGLLLGLAAIGLAVSAIRLPNAMRASGIVYAALAMPLAIVLVLIVGGLLLIGYGGGPLGPK